MSAGSWKARRDRGIQVLEARLARVSSRASYGRLHQADRARSVQCVEDRKNDLHHHREASSVFAQAIFFGNDGAGGGDRRRVVSTQTEPVELAIDRDARRYAWNEPNRAGLATFDR